MRQIELTTAPGATFRFMLYAPGESNIATTESVVVIYQTRNSSKDDIFVAAYYVDSLLKILRPSSLNMHTEIPNWTLDPDTFAVLCRWMSGVDEGRHVL